MLTGSMVGWHRAWAALAKYDADFGTPDAEGETWQYMCSDEGSYHFRHRNKGAFMVKAIPGDEVQIGNANAVGARLALYSLVKRIASIEKSSHSWGGPEAAECQLRLMVETRQMLVRPTALTLDPFETRDAWCRFVATLNGADYNGPLHQILRDEGRLAELPKLLGDFARWVAIEYPPEDP
jgi:hypothetical protein